MRTLEVHRVSEVLEVLLGADNIPSTIIDITFKDSAFSSNKGVILVGYFLFPKS